MTQSTVAQAFAREWPILVAILTRDLGDLGLAEEAAQEAFTEAAARWRPGATPDQPGAWLLTTARRKAIDRVRRDRRFTERLPALLELTSTPQRQPTELIDDQLALIFGCCHTSLNTEAQIALTLRQVCGLSTSQIAEAFLIAPATMAKRLVRAKDKIRKAKVPFTVPDIEALPERLDAVLQVVYLIFTAGHTNAEGPGLVRGDLCDEARWLTEVISGLLNDRSETAANATDWTRGRAEALGLKALMLFTDARRAGRSDDDGRLVLLENQDRSRWNRQMVGEGQAIMVEALSVGVVGPYQLQAAIAALHSSATSWDQTDWRSILWLYDRLVRVTPNPVVKLNRAVALSMHTGPGAGLAAIDELLADGHLSQYRYLHAARADLLRRLGRTEQAAVEYHAALDLGGNEAERRFLTDRLAALGP